MTFTLALGDETRLMELNALNGDVTTEAHFWRGPEPAAMPPLETPRCDALPASGPLADLHAHTLLRAVAYEGRRALAAHRPPSPWPPLSSEGLESRCGWAQAVTRIDLGQLGVPPEHIHCHWAPALLGDERAGVAAHAFVVVLLPNQKAYLVDLTFRQFFGDSRNPDTAVARSLLSTNAGERLADALLYEGWVELTPETATLYCLALKGGLDLPPVAPEDLLWSSRPEREMAQIDPAALRRTEFGT